MPDRIIRDELLESERWLTLKDNADRLAYIALLLKADALGNFSAEPFRLLRLWRDFGISTISLVAKSLSELADHDLIRLYTAEEKQLLHIPRFGQRLRHLTKTYPQSPWTTIEQKQRLINNSPVVSQTQDSPASAEVKGSEVVPSPARKKPAPDSALQVVCRETWQAYSDAYEFRHGAAPIRDAKASSAIKRFCQSVPQSEAPDIARFFLQNNSSFYVQKMHPPTIMAQDAAKLRTEWATGRQITQTQAMQTDKTASRKGVFAKLINEIGENND
jgi:hypothetical protein